MLQRDEVGVGDVVTLLGEVGADALAGLAAATGEEDAHDPFLLRACTRRPRSRRRSGASFA